MQSALLTIRVFLFPSLSKTNLSFLILVYYNALQNSDQT